MPEHEDSHAYSRIEARRGAAQRRRDRIVAEIERNRRGEYWLPTWALVAILLAIVLGWAAVIIFT
ncbi:hypothetical protein [Rugosimonospora acidiphila]